MEEYIKILEEIVETYRSCSVNEEGFDMRVDIGFMEKECEALENLLTRYKQLQKENEEQKADKQYTEQLENILKFAITNHIGNLRGGMEIERYGIDKMQNLRLSIDYVPENNSYIIRVSY